MRQSWDYAACCQQDLLEELKQLMFQICVKSCSKFSPGQNVSKHFVQFHRGLGKLEAVSRCLALTPALNWSEEAGCCYRHGL